MTFTKMVKIMSKSWTQKPNRWPAALCCGLALSILSAVGCSKGGPRESESIASEQNRHILQMASIYRSYRDSHNGKPAASVQQLKEWAPKLPKDPLAKLVKDPPD